MDNQTEELWLVNISQSDTGTGLFVFFSQLDNAFGQIDWCASFDSEIYGPLRKALVEDINYAECVRRGTKEGILAYKWVPGLLASYDSLKSEVTNCDKVYCVKRCARYGCLCVGGECC
jgi:hypothetical protein